MNLHNYLSTANLVKSLVLPLGYYYPLNKIFSNNQNYAVLCYHRISANNKLLKKNNPLSGLEVNQDIFEKQIKFLELEAIKECPGKVICKEQEIKLKIKHEDRFIYLKGKSFLSVNLL